MGIRDWFAGGKAKIATDLVTKTAEGINDIVDRWVQNPQEKADMMREVREFTLKQKEMAMNADRAILDDRASARQMAGIHGKLQTAFALTFLVGFLVLLVADLGFIGWLIVKAFGGEVSVPEWLQILVTNTLTGVIAYMVSMLKEVVGFLFGGSAGGDASSAQLVETLREAQPHVDN